MGNSKFGDHEEEEEEEALSLCDLPINFLGKENLSRAETEANKNVKSFDEGEGGEEDFNFIGSRGDLALRDSEMCIADDVFFQGQILPLRLSVSSDSAASRLLRDGYSRSESLDHRGCYSSGGYSSRSSSTRSNISSSSSSINSTSTITNLNTYNKSKFRNQFHTHPSPKPQIKVSSFPAAASCRRQNSSIWEFLRVGLVRTPEIELQNLKLRTKNNEHFGSGNSSSSTNTKLDLKFKKKQKHFDKSASLFSGCNCKSSADVIEETVTSSRSRVVIIKSKISGSRNTNTVSELETEVMLKMKQGKQRNHQNRTYEWLKELSMDGGDGNDV